VLSENVEVTAQLMSDEWKSFISISEAFAAHDVVRRSEREYARGFVHANSAEASMTASAAPSPTCSITSVRRTPISTSTKSTSAGRNG
jgi:hypothetical protein